MTPIVLYVNSITDVMLFNNAIYSPTDPQLKNKDSNKNLTQIIIALGKVFVSFWYCQQSAEYRAQRTNFIWVIFLRS